MTITSRRNPVVARFRAAAGADAVGLLLLDGAHVIAEAIEAGIHVREAAVVAVTAETPRSAVTDLADRLRQLEVPVTTASASVMSALSPLRSASPIVALADRPAASEARVYRGASLALIAIDVQDPGNVGAIVRVAEASGASGVVCAGACANPFGWKALRGSMGSAVRLPILVRPKSGVAIEEAHRHGYRIVATVPRGGRSLFDADLSGSIAVLIGGEGQGLTPSQIEAADERVTIPMQSPVESLNAAVTAALVVYEASRQKKLHHGGHGERFSP